MDLKNLQLVSIPIEVDLGIPYVKDEFLPKVFIDGDEPLRVRHQKFWQQFAEHSGIYSRGLLMLPLSSTEEEFDIPSRRGDADWNDPRAQEAIAAFAALFTPAFVKLLSEQPEAGDPLLSSKQMLSSVGLVRGTVAIAIPLYPHELGIWAEDKNLASFLPKLKPEWIGICPMSRQAHRSGSIFRRLDATYFDLSRFAITPAAIAEGRRGFYFAGYAPTRHESPSAEGMRNAHRLPVPFSPDNPNLVADGKTPLDREAQVLRKNPKKAGTDRGMAVSFYSVDRSRARDWEVEMPEIWAKLYPRRYVDFAGYMHPKSIARCNAALLFPGSDAEEKARPTQSGLIIPKILRFFAPHYFLSPEIVDAIAQTKFPDDVKASEVQLPVPGLILVLPESQKCVLGVNGTPVHYLLIAEETAAESRKEMMEMLSVLDPKATQSEKNAFVELNVPAPMARGIHVSGISSDGSRLFELPIAWDAEDVITEERVLTRYSSQSPAFAAAAFALTKFAVNTLLYFNAVPQYMEVQRVQNTVRPKGPKAAIDYWTPNVYGRAFRLPKEPTDEPGDVPGASRQGRRPRPHLRAAHWRRQWFGPGFSQCKFVHIDFVWVFPGEDDEPAAGAV